MTHSEFDPGSDSALPPSPSRPASASAGRHVRLLLVEDSPADAGLAVFALEQAGYRVQSDLVRARDRFEALVAAVAYDAILGDYRLPGWTGMDAFRWLRSSGYETPFVLVTGTLGDELAISCVREGVSDYVLKSNLHRLPVVIATLLKQRQLRADRDRAEVRLDASEKQYRVLFEANPHPMWVQEVGTMRFLAVNQAAVEQYGFSREEFLSMTLKDIRPPEELPHFLERFVELSYQMEVKRGVWRHMRKEGSSFDVEITARPIFFQGRSAELVLAQDVTDKLALEEQFRHAQKLDAIGRLAAGVAHDFNNLLSVILACCDMALPELEGNPVQARLRTIESAAVRGASLSRQLLAFSRRQPSRPAILDLNSAIREVETLLRQLAGPHSRLVMNLASDLDRVEADPGHIQQVVMNLTVNAQDAMPQGGVLTIETRNVMLAPAEIADLVEQPDGAYVLLAVSDTGVGMDRETQSRIFEPFFTTKEPGKGTGLGLAAVYGVVRQSGGFIRVDSEPAKGTTFRVYLPRAATTDAVTTS